MNLNDNDLAPWIAIVILVIVSHCKLGWIRPLYLSVRHSFTDALHNVHAHHLLCIIQGRQINKLLAQHFTIKIGNKNLPLPQITSKKHCRTGIYVKKCMYR